MPDAPSTCKTGVLIFCLGEKGVEGRFFNFIELNQSHHDLIEVLGTYLKIFQLFLTYFNFIIHNNKRSRIKTQQERIQTNSLKRHISANIRSNGSTNKAFIEMYNDPHKERHT